MDNTKLIRVSNEFHFRLASHGKFGERFEDILIRLLGKDFEETATGDRDTKVYSVDDVDSKKTKSKRHITFIGKDPGRRSQKTGDYLKSKNLKGGI